MITKKFHIVVTNETNEQQVFRMMYSLLIRLIASLIACLLLASSPVLAREYFVSLNGNDLQPGSRKLPFLSINNASQRALPGDTVTILDGVYPLAEQFRPVRSGTSHHWILYRAYPGQSVIFDGSLIIKVPAKRDSIVFSQVTEGVFQIEKLNYLRFENLQIRNSNAAGFIIRGPFCKKIELIGCKSNRSHNSGIGLWYCDSVLVTNCEITGANDNEDSYYEPGQIKGSEAPHEALSICGARFFEVSYNEVHDCFKEGIDCKEVSTHGIIHHNNVHDLQRQAYYADAWFGRLEDVEFYSNTASNCMWGFAVSVEGAGADLRDVRFHHNLMYNIQGAGILFGLWGSNLMRSDIYIYNNTLYRCGSPNVFSGGVGSIDILSKNFRDVFIYRNICDKGWDYEMGFSFNPKEVKKELADRNFVAIENLFEGSKNRPSRKGQFNEKVYEYLPPNNQYGAPLYRNELKFDFVPELLPRVKTHGRKFKYAPSPWFGAFEPI